MLEKNIIKLYPMITKIFNFSQKSVGFAIFPKIIKVSIFGTHCRKKGHSIFKNNQNIFITAKHNADAHLKTWCENENDTCIQDIWS